MKITYQNLHIDFHARLDVMSDPIPVISFYRYPPEHTVNHKCHIR